MKVAKKSDILAMGVLILAAASWTRAGEPTVAATAESTAQPTVIPITVSPEAQQLLAHPPPPPPDVRVAEQRRFSDTYQENFSAVQEKRYAVEVSDAVLAGVPVRVISPKGGQKASFVMLNVHGGGFSLDSGSLTENIPLAALTHATVYAVRYRLAPEHPFPAALDDVLAVYKELLKTHKPRDIVVYGTSAGAVLTAELAAKLKQDHLPMPAALGFFSGTADMVRRGESELGLNPLIPSPGKALEQVDSNYIGSADRKDPVLSPIYSDLKGWPPILLISSTRDFLLSNTALFHRALLGVGVDARLVVFEALPHAFWAYTDLPESREAFELMARFFVAHAQR